MKKKAVVDKKLCVACGCCLTACKLEAVSIPHGVCAIIDEDKCVVMNDLLDTVADNNIEDRIYVVRGKQVMLDRDLAELYGVETKRLNEQVRRNFERFPDDFMFQMTKEECLRSRIATLNEGRGRHLKYMPYAFTENGIAMLSSVLRSETAIAVNIESLPTHIAGLPCAVNINCHATRHKSAVL